MSDRALGHNPLVLADLSDDDLHARVWHSLVELERRDKLDTLPGPLMTYWHTQLVDYEVYNGGFLQFFHNSFRHVVDDALHGFTRLGLDDHAAVLRRAVDVAARAEVKADIEQIWAADDNLAAFSRVAGLGYFTQLDEEWFALTPAIDVGLAHLRQHAGEVEAALAREVGS